MTTLTAYSPLPPLQVNKRFQQLPTQYLPQGQLQFTLGSEASIADAIIKRIHSGQTGYWVGPVSSSLGFAMKDPLWLKALQKATFISPSNIPIASLISHYRQVVQPAIRVNILFKQLLSQAETNGLPVYFYGGNTQVKERLVEKLRKEYPKLQIAGYTCSKFRPLTEDENLQLRNDIIKSKAKLLFIGTGAPRQEFWMYQNQDLPTFNLGIGNTFNFYAETYKSSSFFWRKLGLHRLVSALRNQQDIKKEIKRFATAFQWEQNAKKNLGVVNAEIQKITDLCDIDKL